ncbi:MAG TPA: dockerin type I domain-containing protein [Anaerolineales bacterium]|nr:dockerin type I domain-containing protein [Anaerolineales bacterium]
MKSKRLFQIFVLLVMLFSSVQPASASTGREPADAVVIDRSLNYWDANYFGFISSGLYENWRFEFTASHNFVVTVSRVTGDVVPMVILLDASDNEIARGTGSLTSTQPAGSYSFQVQPESGMGLYMLTLREVAAPTEPAVTTTVSPASINAGEAAVVTVSLSDVPATGYTSAEFACTYNASVVQVGNITLTDLFGIDPVMAATTPQNGSFILAIAGSNGRKAATSGTAFNFNVTGVQAGQTSIECQARISKGDGVLTALPSTPANLTVIFQNTPTPTFTSTPVVTEETPVPTDTPTSTPTPIVTEETPVPTDTPTSTSTPVVTEETPTETPTSTLTPIVTEETPTDTPTSTSTPVVTEEKPTHTATPTSTPLPTTGTLSGEVHAGKPVTVGLYDASNILVVSVAASTDGSFSLTAPAGVYSVRATAPGYLSAAASVTITAGETSTKPAVTLLAGDIDNNDVIDQFDAMTVGMSYNTATPEAADLNGDGTINVLDLELLARNYRAAGPSEW